MTEPSSRNDPILALSEYFLSVTVMHDLTEEMKPIFAEKKREVWTEFRTFYSYWLSGLFVVAEGFQTLGLKNPKIEKMITDHIDELRLFRNSTFHFQKTPAKHTQFLDADRIKWAEELHDAFRKYFKRYADKLVKASSGRKSFPMHR